MDQVKIGRFIAELRKEQKITQLELATKIGVTDRAISKWENGRGLPDISLISPLCEALSISIDELLEGERVESSQKLTVAHKNLINILGDREQEKRKTKKLLILFSLFLIIVILTYITLIPMCYASLRGDGYSFTAAYATQLAKSVSNSISKGDFSKAAKSIGFPNPKIKDRSVAEEEWVASMEDLREKGFSIKQLTISRMISDDHHVLGGATIIVYDREKNRDYIFNYDVYFDDGGITFLKKRLNIEEGREEEIVALINDALCTYYAG